MSATPVTVREAAPLRDAAQLMRQHLSRQLPVLDEFARLVGIITDRDIRQTLGFGEPLRGNLTVPDVMTADPVTIPVGGPVGMREVYADWWDLEANTKTFRGFSIMESGSGVLDTSTGRDNPNGLEVALNNLNNDGVIGCGPFEDPCYSDDEETVAAAAPSSRSGRRTRPPPTFVASSTAGDWLT